MTTGLRAKRLVRAGLSVLLVLFGACAPVPQTQGPARTQQVVYPPPPDEARFVYERTFYSSSDVLAEDSTAEFRRKLLGENRRGEGFTKPYAVAVHKGRIFLSDSVERFIKVIDLPQGKFFRIGDDEPGRLAKPLGIDVDANGTLYVADASAKAIMVYDRDGKFLRKLGGEKWFSRLSSVTVDPRGDRVFAVDIGGVNSEHHRVRVFDSIKGNHLFDIGTRGSGPGEFNLPRDLAVGKDGQLFVVDGGNFRVQVFDRDGKYLKTFGGVGKQVGNFARPKEIATDRVGNVYIVDTAFGNFQIFGADGEMLMYIGERSERDGPAKYMLPSGIYVDEDGRIYMVDQWFRKVDIFRPAAMKVEDGYLGARGRPAVKASK